jgi:trk system potassium uptake protein TrkH
MLLPLLLIAFYPSEIQEAVHFSDPAALLAIMGIILWRLFKVKEGVTLNSTWGGIIVLFSWTIICVFSAFPFITGEGLSFTGAVFESVSGWSTTGLSVIDVTVASHITLFFRSLIQLLGGAGIVIMMMAAIIGPLGPGLSVAEGREIQLVPHVVKSTRIVVRLYLSYAVFGFFALWIAGMSPFDAINHAFAAISTGGFSTKPESIGYWNSASVEIVTCILMILGNMSFLTAYLLFHGKFRQALRDGEMKLLAIAIPLGIFILFFTIPGTTGFAEIARAAIFQTLTAVTTTGFNTVPIDSILPLGFFTIIIFMIIGGGTYSTAGGLKQIRVYLVIKSIIWDLKQRLLPRRSVVSNFYWKGEEREFVGWNNLGRLGAFIGLYLATFVVGSAIFLAHGYSIENSLFEFASALGTVGLSIGIISPEAPRLVLWTGTFGMLLGRLEFFVIITSLILLFRDFRRFALSRRKRV